VRIVVSISNQAQSRDHHLTMLTSRVTRKTKPGLQLLGHRYYDPSTGRFLTRDPIEDERNCYGYCDSNPVDAVDADGLKRILVQKGDAYYDKILAAINEIAKVDPAMADHLRRALDHNQIYVETDPNAMGRIKGLTYDSGSILLNWEKVKDRASLLSVLLHEGYHHIHHRNNNKLSHAQKEIEATTCTIKMLRRIRDLRNKKGDKCLNSSIEDAIYLDKWQREEFQNQLKGGGMRAY
jgi:RHS repeat-associated protein